MSLTPVLGKQRQVDFGEFKVGLVYIRSFRTSRAIIVSASKKQKYKYLLWKKAQQIIACNKKLVCLILM